MGRFNHFMAGTVMMIYQDPITQKKPEGEAKLIKREDDHHGPARPGDCERWTVEFLSEPGATYSRLIYRKLLADES